MEEIRYRAIFISDIHLGTKDSQTDLLLDFMRDYESEYLFLVGDIIDGWALRRRWLWLQGHSDVIQKFLRKARKGTKVFYVLGNHDEFIRPFLPFTMGDNVEIADHFEYTDLNGHKYLVTHGDFFDTITMTKRWLAVLGDMGYQTLLRLNRPINYIRRHIGLKHWSLSKFVKENVKKSLVYIADFEKILSDHAKNHHYDGVVCGHIHKAEIRSIEGIKYLNCGDWVESCSAVVETLDGEWKIVSFHH